MIVGLGLGDWGALGDLWILGIRGSLNLGIGGLADAGCAD